MLVFCLKIHPWKFPDPFRGNTNRELNEWKLSVVELEHPFFRDGRLVRLQDRLRNILFIILDCASSIRRFNRYYRLTFGCSRQMVDIQHISPETMIIHNGNDARTFPELNKNIVYLND